MPCLTDGSVTCATGNTTKPRASSDGMAKPPRPLSNIMPSGGIRPASSVSTQTSANQVQNQVREWNCTCTVTIHSSELWRLTIFLSYNPSYLAEFSRRRNDRIFLSQAINFNPYHDSELFCMCELLTFQAKHRGKPGVRSPAPTSKQDAANQTNKMQHQMQQPKQQ